MLLEPVEIRLVRNRDPLEQKGGVVLHCDYRRPHRQEPLQKPVVVSVDVDGQNSKRAASEVLFYPAQVLQCQVPCLDTNVVGKQTSGEPDSPAIAVDQQTRVFTDKADAVELVPVEAEFHERVRRVGLVCQAGEDLSLVRLTSSGAQELNRARMNVARRGLEPGIL